MKNILFVDDDPFIATLYRFKLTSEGFSVKVARDGEEAIEVLKKETPNLIILDWMLPKIDGIGVLKYARAQPVTQATPVILFSNNFLHNQESVAMQAGASRCIAKASFSAKQMIEIIRELLSPKQNLDANQTTSIQDGKSKGVVESSPSCSSRVQNDINAGSKIVSNADFQAAVIKQINELAPEWFNQCQKNIEKIAFTKTASEKPVYLANIARIAHTVCSHAAMAGFIQASQMASGIEALCNSFTSESTKITPSLVRTLAQAMDLTAMLVQRIQHANPPAQNPPLILGVDDSAIHRRLLLASLEKVKLRTVVVEDAALALRLVAENHFDLFFLDVEMPEMNGFELCAALRSLPQYKTVPVIFVTAHTDFQSQNRSILSGGTDFINKPYVEIELGVKTLFYIISNQFQIPTKELRKTLSSVDSEIVWS